MFNSLSFLMYDPLRMVLVNIIASAAVLGSAMFYRFVYPKKEINKTYFCIAIGILPIISIFRKGIYDSGDMALHISRSASFYNQLKYGLFFPRWYPEANATYGYPLFRFAYSLPYYITSVYHSIGFNFVSSMKALLITTHLFSGYFMYLWIRKHFSRNASLVASIFYIFAPYHLINMHFRTSVGEIVALMVLPLMFYGAKRFSEKRSAINLFIFSMSISLLIISHQVTTILISPIIISYTLYLFRPKNVKAFLVSFLPLIWGVMIATYYWLPTLIDVKYTQFADKYKHIEFFPFKSFIFTPWRFGLLFQGHVGEFNAIVGYIQLITILLSIILIFKRKIRKEFKTPLLFILTVVALYLFMTNSASLFIWNLLPILKNMQFSYRFMAVVLFLTSIIGAIVYESIPSNKLFYILIISASIPTLLNWGNRSMNPNYKESEILNFNYMKTIAAVYTSSAAAPKWLDPVNTWQDIIPNKHLEVLSGNAQIKELARTPIQHKYNVQVNEMSEFKENTYYFPGWKVIANGQDINITYLNPNYQGIILFNLPEGNYYIEVIYGYILTRKIAVLVSTFSLLALSLLLFKNFEFTY